MCVEFNYWINQKSTPLIRHSRRSALYNAPISLREVSGKFV